LLYVTCPTHLEFIYVSKPFFDNSSIERVEEFKYLGTTLTSQNSTQEEIKSRLKSGNACYHSVRNLLCFRLLSKNLKMKIYRTIILPVPSWYSIPIYHHPPHWDNVTAPHGRPNPRSQLHFSHNEEGDHKVHDGHVVALDKIK
jgi:hypothetical protein